jgi:two-component system, NarL family, sensor kinase
MATLARLMPTSAPSTLYENVEQERQRIARDLHDSIGGMLSTALLLFDGVDAQNKDRFQKVKNILQETQREVRRIAHGLSPAALTKLGLVAALEQYSEEINSIGALYVDLCILDRPFFKTIDKALQINAYRMAQELFQNALKHSDASHLELLVHHSATHLIFMYEDDGKGCETLNQSAKGMRSLRERVKLLNGKIRIKSIENQGTIVKIEVPF